MAIKVLYFWSGYIYGTGRIGVFQYPENISPDLKIPGPGFIGIRLAALATG